VRHPVIALTPPRFTATRLVPVSLQQTSDPIEWSIIIPAHNEAARILPYLRNITSYMRDRGQPYEVLVVDDGSTDDTASVVEAMIASAPEIRLLRAPRRQGKGAAVRRGMGEAVGRLQLFADADGATPIQELARLEQALAAGADLAIGSRSLASRLPDYAIKARLHRTILGNLFNSVVQRSGLRGIADTQCGFKLFRRTVAQDLFGCSSINGYGFDLELLYVARQRGYNIAEIPVNWSDQPGSKVQALRDGLAMLRELALIRQKSAKGDYASPSHARNSHPATDRNA
jgi:dolichyl-phosphate beta-glucosyltransferase